MHAENGTKLVDDDTMCMMFIDSDREAEIDLGVGWPFDKLEKDECIIASTFKKKGVKKGDTILITFKTVNYWQTMRF